MKIAIVAPSPIPFSPGGAERLWSGLYRAINERTEHSAELIKVPGRESSLVELVAWYQKFATLDLHHFDLVITGKYPAWLIGHRQHVIYLLHRLRGLYDTYHLFNLPTHVDDGDLQELRGVMARGWVRSALPDFFAGFENLVQRRGADDPLLALPGPLARELVHWLDGVGFQPPNAMGYAAISRTVARRTDYFPSAARVSVLHPPTDLSGLHSSTSEYFFTASRLDTPKRIDLLISAMRYVTAPLDLVIAGGGPQRETCQELARKDPRIRFVGHVSDEQLVDLYAGARAVPFIPDDEDYGYITLEAMLSSKPVITANDSGGPTELVNPGVNGLVVQPTADAVGGALQLLATDSELASRMGEVAYRDARGVSWDAVLGSLLGSTVEPLPPPRPRRQGGRAVVLSIAPVGPRQGGGQLRTFHLCAGLATELDVELISLGTVDAANTTTELAPYVMERVVPKSAEHDGREQALAQGVGWIPVSDIAAGSLVTLTPAYMDAVRTALADAKLVILSHPYLAPVLDLLDCELPMVYDAQDAELVLKRGVLPDTPAGRELLDETRRLEALACHRAALVVTCSDGDGQFMTREYDCDAERVMTISNGADLDLIRYTPPEERAWRREVLLRTFADPVHQQPFDRSVLFVGSWHPPNNAAGERLVGLAANFPSTIFFLAGQHTDALTRPLNSANVVALGRISDTLKATLLASCDLGLNPMGGGTGTNLKLIEYFAAGLPVVTTDVGARGIDAVPGEHLWSSSGEHFLYTLRLAQGDPLRSARMATAARRLAEERYSWAKLGSDFRRAAQGLVAPG